MTAQKQQTPGRTRTTRGNTISVVFTALFLAFGLHAGAITGNLLTNPGAETGDLTGWTLGQNFSTTGAAGTTDSVMPHTGSFQFFGGALQPFSNSSIFQTISLVGGAVTAAKIDSGTLTAVSSFWEQSVDGHAGQNVQTNSANFVIGFLDGSQVSLGTVIGNAINFNGGSWTFFSLDVAIPANARSLVYNLNFGRAPSLNFTTDAFADDLSVVITDPASTTPNTPEPGSLGLVLAGAAALTFRKRGLRRLVSGNQGIT